MAFFYDFFFKLGGVWFRQVLAKLTPTHVLRSPLQIVPMPNMPLSLPLFLSSPRPPQLYTINNSIQFQAIVSFLSHFSPHFMKTSWRKGGGVVP